MPSRRTFLLRVVPAALGNKQVAAKGWCAAWVKKA